MKGALAALPHKGHALEHLPAALLYVRGRQQAIKGRGSQAAGSTLQGSLLAGDEGLVPAMHATHEQACHELWGP